MMIKNEIISIMLAALVAIVCLFAVAAPVSAGIGVTIDPCRSLPGASPGYTCVLNYLMDDCDIYFVNVTIPKGYNATDPVDCDCSEIILTLRNESAGDIISKSVAFQNETGHWVVNCEDCTACLSLTMPTTSANGSINISLGALGPLTPGDNMTLEFASDCIKNPKTSGRYNWSVTTDDSCSHADSGVVCIMHPGDITGDDKVNVFDLRRLAIAFLSVPGKDNWNQCADFNCDETINVKDLKMLANNFMK
jgi:hypothetical protein